jgi:hypothetical protein
MFIDRSNPDFDGYMHIFKTVAEEFYEILRFVFVDSSVEGIKERKKEIGLSPDIPVGIAFNLAADVTLVYPEGKPITIDSLAQFVRDWKSGTLKPKRPEMKKSDLLDAAFADVKPIVMMDWESLVLHQKKDVMVMFYSS